MNSHLNINVNGTDLELGEDFEISVEDQNPLWNDDEMFSYPVQIPLDGNRALVQNIEQPQAGLRPIELEHLPVKISVDGMPFRNGTAVMTEDEEIADSLTMNVDASEQSFDDLIGDLECRDVVIPKKYKSALLIGEKIGNVKCSIDYTYSVKVDIRGGKDKHEYSTKGRTVSAEFEPQALGFSYPAKCMVKSDTTQEAQKHGVKNYDDGIEVIVPKVDQDSSYTGESYINVSSEYPSKFYANARVCYKHYAKDEDGSTSSSVVDASYDDAAEDKYPYWVLDADRPQSGICFYILFFLDCLFDNLGVSFDKSALLAIPDFKRLCFFTTHCKYDTDVLHGGENNPFFSGSCEGSTYIDPESGQEIYEPVTSYQLETVFKDVNTWLSSRGCGGKLYMEAEKTKDIQKFKLKDGTPYVVGQGDCRGIESTSTVTKASFSANIMAMYANSDNFPDESVSTIIDSLENQFGIKFHYDYQQNKVTAYLLRNVYRDQSAAKPFLGNVLSMTKVTEKITGVRVCYSNESDSKEQQDNVKNGVKDYDTDYDYIDYPQDRTVTDKTYQQIFQNITASDMNVYVDRKTGNAYRIKVNNEATTAAEMKPVLFEVGALKGVEIGDCSEQNEDFVEELTSDFTPIMFNDVNYQKEISAASGTEDVYDETGEVTEATINDNPQPILAAYVDEDMEHEFIEQLIKNTMGDNLADFYLVESLSLVESYDPSDTDDGNSPLQDYDWGNAIAVMRGGGTNQTTQPYDYNYDGFNNSKWRTVAGEYAMATDTMDAFGNIFDYNGTDPGVGDEERFSLKIRAYKQPDWSDVPLCDSEVALRGTFDTFMSEHAHFLLHRKKFIIKIEAEPAFLADIPNHWRERYEFDGMIGYINKVSYTLSAKDGVKDAEIEFFAL